jgi:ParB/RepB/Spo0J family partition protein
MSRSAAREALSLRAAPPRAAELVERGDLLWIETQYLQPDPDQPRKSFDEQSLAELGESLADVGVLTPLRVRPADPNTGLHTITDGERRWRAGQAAGIVVYPCLVEAADPAHAFLEAYLANLHRDALSPVDAAVGLQHIRETFSLAGDDEVAARLKKSVGWVRQMNAVLGLDRETRTTLLERGEPVAVAVGLRPQKPAERRATLEAIAELPSRDSKVRFIGRVNDHRRAGRPIDEAISLAQTTATTSPSPDSGREQASVPSASDRRRPGRPRRFTPLFTWRAIAEGIQVVDIDTAGLATTQLASTRSADVDQWVAAVRADLIAFRDRCAAEPHGAEAWGRVLEELAPVLSAS